MAEITSKEDFKKWLKDKPRDVCVVMAVRTAMRVLPYLKADYPIDSQSNKTINLIKP